VVFIFCFVYLFFSPFHHQQQQQQQQQLQQKRTRRDPNVSKTGGFEGMNPTIDNPTAEYRAVIFATKELAPLSSKVFEYKSSMRQEPKKGFAVRPNELDETTQLA